MRDWFAEWMDAHNHLHLFRDCATSPDEAASSLTYIAYTYRILSIAPLPALITTRCHKTHTHSCFILNTYITLPHHIVYSCTHTQVYGHTHAHTHIYTQTQVRTHTQRSECPIFYKMRNFIPKPTYSHAY